MSLQHKISIETKVHNFEKLYVYVDNILIKGKSSKYSWIGDGGKHTLKIEQDKITKKKYYWLLWPVYFLIALITGDGDLYGKTPCYVVYEADINVNKDMDISVELYDVNKDDIKVKHGFCYNVAVNYPNATEINLIKDEFTATQIEKSRWFMFYVILWSILFAFLTFSFVGAGISSLNTEFGIIGTTICLIISAICIVDWIFLIRKYYKWYNGQY